MWNYRVIKTTKFGVSYGIYEVYYTKGKPTSWSAEPIYPIGETFMDLIEDFNYMKEALLKPILELKNGKLINLTNK